MSTDNKDFEDFFRERLEGLEEAPPANGWEKIRQDIKQPWYRKVNWLAAAALLCLLSVAVYFATRLPQPAEQSLARQTGKTVQPVEKTGVAANNGNEAATNPAGTSSVASKEAAVNAKETAGAENLASGANQPQTTGTFSAQNPTVSEPETKPETNLPLIALNRTPEEEKPATREPVEGQTERSERPVVAAGSARAKTIAAAGLVAATGNRYARTAKKSLTETNATQPASAPEELVSSRSASPAQTSETTTAVTAKEAADAPGTSLNQEIAMLALRGLNSNQAPVIFPETLPFVALTFAQNPDSAASKNMVKPLALWALSGFVSPRSTFTKYSPNRTDGKLIQNLNKTNNGLSDVLSYETGFTVHRALTDRLSLDAGLTYTALKDEVHYLISAGDMRSVKVQTRTKNAADVEVAYNFFSESLKTRYHYAGLRLGTSYMVAQKDKTRFYVSGGGIVQVLASSRAEVYRNGALVTTSVSDISQEPLRKLNGQLYGSFGISRQFDEKWHVFAEPGFGYFLGSAFRKEEVLQLKPVTAGFNFGLRYEL